MNVPTSTSRRLARVYLPLATLVTGLLLGACGPTASITLSLGSSTVTMFLGSSEEVEVTLTRSADATAAVVLSASGAPEWVTVSFSPATLAGSALTSTMTIATDSGHAEAGPATFTLAVSAQGPGLSGTAQLAVVVEELDVSGVVTGRGGTPLAGYTVYIPGHTPVVSAADGTFAFDSVAAPYDLTVADLTAGGSHTFVDVTTANPVVQPLLAVLGASSEHSASVSGNLAHGSLVPLPAGHMGYVCVEGVDVSVTGCTTVTASGSTYTLSASWSGDATRSVRLRAFIATVDGEQEPLAIVASGTVGVFDLTAGDSDLADITLSSSSTQTVIGSTVTVPIGYTLGLRKLVATHSDVASSYLGDTSGSTLTRDVIAPFFSGADYSLLVTAQHNDPTTGSTTIAWAAGLTPGDSVSLDLARPAVQLSPPDAATGVTTATEFALSNPDGGVMTFFMNATGGGSSFAVTTEATTATIPNLTAIGLPLPAAKEYGWTVLTSHDVATVDDAVTGSGYLGEFLRVSEISSGGAPAPTAGGRISAAVARTFTSQ